MSGVLGTEAYKQYFDNPKSYRQGAITASMPAGSLVGSLFSSFLADRYSRRVALQISCILWIVGSILQCASQNIGMLCTGRVIAGFCVGIASAVVPVYQVRWRLSIMWFQLLTGIGRDRPQGDSRTCCQVCTPFIHLNHPNSTVCNNGLSLGVSSSNTSSNTAPQPA